MRSSPGVRWWTLEELAAPRAVAVRAREAADRGELAGISLPADGNAHDAFTAVATAAVRGHAGAVALITESAENLATAVVPAANLLDLDSVVLAGPSFATAGSLYVEVVKRRLDAEFFASAKHGVRVRLSNQVAEAAAVGAALVLQQHLAPRSFGGH